MKIRYTCEHMLSYEFTRKKKTYIFNRDSLFYNNNLSVMTRVKLTVKTKHIRCTFTVCNKKNKSQTFDTGH